LEPWLADIATELKKLRELLEEAIMEGIPVVVMD